MVSPLTPDNHAQTHAPGGSDPLPVTIWDLYEVGDIHISIVLPSPIPSGWQLIGQDRVLIGAGTTYNPGDTMGSATVTPSAHTGTAVAAHTSISLSAHSGLTMAPDGDHVHDDVAPVTTVPSGTAAKNAWNADQSSSSAGTHSHAITSQGNDHTLSSNLTHSVTQPSDHSALSTLQPGYAVYFFLKVA